MEAEDRVIMGDEDSDKVIREVAEALGYQLTDEEVRALEYHIMSGAGIRYMAA